jgi:hypothetical protein
LLWRFDSRLLGTSIRNIRARKYLLNAYAVLEQLTLNQRVQGSSPCAPTNQTIEIPTRNPCSAVLQAFPVMRKVPKRF